MPSKPANCYIIAGPSLTEKAMQALSDAVAKVVAEHRRQARPLAVWRDGKAVWVSARQENRESGNRK